MNKEFEAFIKLILSYKYTPKKKKKTKKQEKKKHEEKKKDIHL